MNTTASYPGRTRITRAVRFARSARKRGADVDRQAAVQAWATARFSLDELTALLAVIQRHAHRLQAFGGVVAPQAVLEAVLDDATKDPALGGALLRAWVLDQEQRRVAEH